MRDRYGHLIDALETCRSSNKARDGDSKPRGDLQLQVAVRRASPVILCLQRSVGSKEEEAMRLMRAKFLVAAISASVISVGVASAVAHADDFKLAMVIKSTTNPYYNATLAGANIAAGQGRIIIRVRGRLDYHGQFEIVGMRDGACNAYAYYRRADCRDQKFCPHEPHRFLLFATHASLQTKDDRTRTPNSDLQLQVTPRLAVPIPSLVRAPTRL